MDTFTSTSPVATVQLVPIFTYLNMLNNFLLTENYLAAVNQNKQIPIVNALYEYLENHRNNQPELDKLIRNLLQGSDLYGEQDNEQFDEIFVNAMFDYIISSLVFDKYGNIYGFLADIVRNVENLNVDHVLKVIKKTLKNATFENENGSKSALTQLTVNRIYTDIISPIFPVSETNLSVVSLDYMFAQAGSMYLRLGRIDKPYYSSVEKRDSINHENLFHKHLFHEYLITGHVIRYLIHHKTINPLTLRAFALPALLYYISTNDTIKQETTTNLIFSAHHWETAFRQFFQNAANTFSKIEHQLTQDYIYQIHLALSHFQNISSLAKSVLDSKCDFLNERYRETRIPVYIKHAEHFECAIGTVLPNLNDLFKDQIHDIGEIYEKYDLGISHQALDESLIGDLRNVVISLLTPDDLVSGNNFNGSHYLNYDLLQFHYTVNETFEYYALVRENNTARLIKEADDPKHFRKIANSAENNFRSSVHRIILKFANEGVNELRQELMKYKKERFKFYLNSFGDNLKQNGWWKEFGLSSVTFYDCLENFAKSSDDESEKCKEKECKEREFKEEESKEEEFKEEELKEEELKEVELKEEECKEEKKASFNKFSEKPSSDITHPKTQSLLTTSGTTIKTIFLKDVIIETVNGLVGSQNLTLPSQNTTDTVYQQLSLFLEDPEFETTSITRKDIELVTTVMNDLKNKINYNFAQLSQILNAMEFLKISFQRKIGTVGENGSRELFVNTLNINTGFGYKFIKLYSTDNKTVIAPLRTSYEFKDKMFVAHMYKKTYIRINNITFDYEPNYFIYKINNHLWKKAAKAQFSKIYVHPSIHKCTDDEYMKKAKYSDCLRHQRRMEQNQKNEQVIQSIKTKLILDGARFVSMEQIRNALKKYTFPDDSTFTSYFVKNWSYDSQFEESDWSKFCIIDNPDLLNKLRYDLRLENSNITIPGGKYRINSNYTPRERYKIEEGTSFENIIRNYNEQQAGYSVTFEDYYAIRNFVTTGATRITGDTREAKLMKLAVYRLAIRQSDDLRQEFEWTLFRVESKPINSVYNELYVGKRVILQKFTMTSTSAASASRFAAYAAPGFRNVMYEMKFIDPYFRVAIETKVEQFEPFREKKVILLPETEFLIEKISIVQIGGIGNVLLVVMTSKRYSNNRYDWYKYVMREITKIKL